MYRPLFLALFLVVGCGGGDLKTSPEPNDVLDRMASLTLDSVDEAYGRLDGYAYTLTVSLEEIDRRGQVLNSAMRIVRRTPTRDGVQETIIEADSSGTGAAGIATGEPLQPLNPLPSILPDELPYVSSRTHDRYAYEVLPDTVVDGDNLHVIQATLHEQSAKEQPIRYARYYYAENPNSTETLVGLDVLRITTSMLFNETSHIGLRLQHVNGAWLPQRTVSVTTIQTPLSEPVQHRLTQTIRDITAVE